MITTLLALLCCLVHADVVKLTSSAEAEADKGAATAAAVSLAEVSTRLNNPELGPTPPTKGMLRTAVQLLESASLFDEYDPLAHAAAEARRSYEKRLELMELAPKPIEKLRKARDKARAALEKLEKDDWDEDMTAEGEKKLDRAEKALRDAEAAHEARAPRDKSLGTPLHDLVARHAGGGDAALPAAARLEVLRESPLVLVADNWLGEAGASLLSNLSATFEEHTTLEHDHGGEYHSPSTEPLLCLPREGAEGLLELVGEAVAAALHASEAGEEHCAATAELAEILRLGADAAGATALNLTALAATYASESCGPLTPALDAALVTSHSVSLDVSASLAVDLLDAMLAGLLGFGTFGERGGRVLDGEKLAAEIKTAASERPDPEALAPPEGWDAEEDGEWEPPMLPGREVVEVLRDMVKGGGARGTALVDAYAFSSPVTLTRHRGGGGAAPHAACKDYFHWGRAAPTHLHPRGGGGGFALDPADAFGPSPSTAVTAMLFAGEGPDLSFPALGELRIAPAAGRVLLFESQLLDGSCDPAVVLGTANPAPPGGGAPVLTKRFFHERSDGTARAHPEANAGGGWSRHREGPARGVAKVVCTGASYAAQTGERCTRFEHAPAKTGLVVLALREAAAKRKELCPADANLRADRLSPCVAPPPPPPEAKPAKPARGSRAEKEDQLAEKIRRDALPKDRPPAPPRNSKGRPRAPPPIPPP
jgi:hypothetical protein